MSAASSGSHLSPFDSNFSASEENGQSLHNKIKTRLAREKEGQTFVVEQLFPRLGCILGIGRLNNRIDGAGFLAETAVDALGHVDI